MICHWCRFLLIGIFGLEFISIIAEQNFVMVLSLGVGAMLTFGVY